MFIVAFLSMWISATSCVAILVPVVIAIIDEIHEVCAKNSMKKL